MCPELSVVIPTYNRTAALRGLLTGLTGQRDDDSRIEFVVVDDGSDTPVEVTNGSASVRVLRRERGERSTARNHGASHAAGEILLFLDDDLEPSPGLLLAHLVAHREWPGCIAVGAIRLPQTWAEQPFGRFRQTLESRESPATRGPVRQANFATAANMSISRDHFRVLGGFDPLLASAEDQDLAIRHSSAGGRIVYLPEAGAVHNDENATLAAYCRRVEWGAEHMVPFLGKHPGMLANIDRVAANGPVRWGDPASTILKKVLKAGLGNALGVTFLLEVAAGLERRKPDSTMLPAVYRLLLGIHLQRGFRRGWRSQRRSR